MAKLERTYNIPLRREVHKSPKYKRAKKAVSVIKIFLERHMKSADIKIGEQLNKILWERGIKNPPHHVKVTAIREEDGLVKVELFGKEYEVKKKQVKVEKTKMQEALEKAGIKKDKSEAKEEKKEEKPKEEVKPKEEKKEEAKSEPKEEAKPEVKKEEPKVEKPKEEKKPEPKPEAPKPAPKVEAKPAEK